MEDHRRRLHILAVPFPAQSHISGMMHLCRKIAASRPDQVVITFVNVDSIHHQMSPRFAAPDGLDIRLDSVPFRWQIPNGFDAYCVRNNGLFADDADKELDSELKSLATRLSTEVSPVRCIVSDYFLPWTQRVADELGIHQIVFWPGTASWACIEFQIPELAAKKHIFSSDKDDCVVDYVGGIAPILKSDLPAYLKKSSDELWIKHGLLRSPTFRTAAWVLVNSFYSLEQRAFDFMREKVGDKFVPVPLASSSRSSKTRLVNGDSNSATALRNEDADCLAWLSTKVKNSVLYISFGSITVLNREQFQELAAALESSGVQFLWVVRPEFVIGGLEDETLAAFCRRVGDRGRIISWAPQVEVLKHQSTGGFLTHCGWNSILESISNGVPMLGWPWDGEQNTNCRLMVEEWKIGLELPVKNTDLVPQEEISRVIKLVMDENSSQMQEIRAKVEQLKAATVEAAEDGERHIMAMLDELS